MSIQAKTSITDNTVDEQQILDYLRDNPEFFHQHTELLSELRLSHSSGTAVSLIEHQVTVLRDKNRELKNKLLNLVQVARDNDRLNERIHRMVLDMLKASSLTALLDTLSEHLHTEFNADAIAIHLTGLNESLARETGASLLTLSEKTRSLFSDACTAGTPLCGRLKQEQLDFLFEDRATALESAAVIPVGDKASQGLLAIGSREASRFYPGMGTHFLGHLGELLGQILCALDDSPPVQAAT